MADFYETPMAERHWPLSRARRSAIIARLQPLIDYAAAAPATDPGEGYWDTIDGAFGCGERAASFDAAEMMRGVLTALGLDAPDGYALCPGCSRAATGEEGHDPDCECDDDLAEAGDGFTCNACGREELTCSREPCVAVIDERGDDDDA